MNRTTLFLVMLSLITAPGLSVASEDLDDVIQKKYPRVSIAHLPTPLEDMEALSKVLGGPRLYVKRDDQTGLAFGGNKARKLDFIFADILEKKTEVVVTWAGVQSNWARQTAAAARMFGIKPVLVLAKNEASPTSNGNLLLDALLDAEVHILEPGQERAPVVEKLIAGFEASGATVYSAPVGGSMPEASMEKPLGAVAYAYGFEEMVDQATARGITIDHVVLATGGGGTQAGLMVGAKAIAPQVQIVGISTSREKGAAKENVAEIANLTAEALGLDFRFTAEETIVFDDYLGEGYGVLSESIVESIRLLARHQGILIDPVYTGKAMAGLIDLIGKGYFDEDDNVVFLHTGGTPALFAYEEELLRMLSASSSN